MSDLERLIDERVARTVPPVEFVVPDGLHALPVHASAEERAEAAAELPGGLARATAGGASPCRGLAPWRSAVFEGYPVPHNPS
ncbi:hypothetical protein [Streptomyces sp. NPDC007088]|uniref:hypothetical protein n=1 Tax=Streptomyces sp. NPDC007088 TaxID=3364773 RepID=UPI00367FA530